MYVFQVQSSKIISVENKFKNVHDSFCPFFKKDIPHSLFSSKIFHLFCDIPIHQSIISQHICKILIDIGIKKRFIKTIMNNDSV